MRLTKERLRACVCFTMFRFITPHIKDDSAWEKDGAIMKVFKDFSDGTIENSIREPVKNLMKSNPKAFLDIVERGKKCEVMLYEMMMLIKKANMDKLTPEEKCWATSNYTDECSCWDCPHAYECSASGFGEDDD